MAGLFSLDELRNEAIKESAGEIKVQKFILMHHERIEGLKKLLNRFPGKDEIFFLWTLNSFNTFTFIPYIIKEFSKIDSLIFSTYSINSRIVQSLVKWFDKGKISNIDILISDSHKHRMPKVDDLMRSLADQRPGLKINYAWNHSKITLISAAGQYFIIEGSENFSENAQHEQYVFLNNKEIYDFRLKCIYESAITI